MNIIKIFSKKIFFFSFCILILSSGEGSSSDLEFNEVNVPLPYQINFDTAAFMSCPGDTFPDDPLFFTFKFGAYMSGLKLAPDTNLKGWNSLIDARAQLTLSQTGSPGIVARRIDDNGDISQILNLNYPQVQKNLLRDGVSYRLGQSSVELELPYPGNDLLQLLSMLNNEFTVYLTYNDGKDYRPLKTKEYYYGRSFNFDFDSRQRGYLTLAGIEEYDLRDNRPHGEWFCLKRLHFAIHRHPILRFSDKWECQEDKSVLSDWDRQLFSVLMKDQNFIYGKTVKQVQDSSGTTQYTALDQKCIRPADISFGCYNNNPAIGKMVDFEATDCTLQGDGTKVCPAFLSICIKKQEEKVLKEKEEPKHP